MYNINRLSDLDNKHPAELNFHKMIDEVKSLLEKCESQYLDGDDRERIFNELKMIKDKLFNLQMERFTQYINDRGKVEGMPEDEESLQREMTGLTVRMNRLLKGNEL